MADSPPRPEPAAGSRSRLIPNSTLPTRRPTVKRYCHGQGPARRGGGLTPGGAIAMKVTDVGINGVQLATAVCHRDDRGFFYEAFRASWFGGERRWVQWNVSHSRADVLRGLLRSCRRVMRQRRCWRRFVSDNPIRPRVDVEATSAQEADQRQVQTSRQLDRQA